MILNQMIRFNYICSCFEFQQLTVYQIGFSYWLIAMILSIKLDFKPSWISEDIQLGKTKIKHKEPCTLSNEPN